VCLLWRGTHCSGNLPHPGFCACSYLLVYFVVCGYVSASAYVPLAFVCPVALQLLLQAGHGARGVALRYGMARPSHLQLTLGRGDRSDSLPHGFWAPAFALGSEVGLRACCSLSAKAACGRQAGAAPEEVQLSQLLSTSPAFRKKGNANPSLTVMRYIRESMCICT